MTQQRILLMGGVALVKGRVPEAGLVMKELCDEIEPLLREVGFVDSAPFKTISLIFRFGNKTSLTPIYDPIKKRHAELPVAVELELAGLRVANKETLKKVLFSTTIDVLIGVAHRYNLPLDPLEKIKTDGFTRLTNTEQ